MYIFINHYSAKTKLKALNNYFFVVLLKRVSFVVISYILLVDFQVIGVKLVVEREKLSRVVFLED